MSSFLQGLILPFAGSGSLHVNVLNGSGVGPRPCVVYVHGGGWSNGSYLNVPPTFVDVINHGITVISVEYTPSNLAKFPQQIHDIKGAIRWIRANAATLNIDPNHIGIGGESAGAHLSFLVAYTNSDPAHEGNVGGNATFSSNVNCVFGYSGPTYIPTIMSDFTVKPLIDWTNPRSGLSLLIGGFPKNNVFTSSLFIDVSPVNHASTSCVPTLIVHGTKDQIIPFAQSLRLYNSLTSVNAPVTNLALDTDVHGWSISEVADKARTRFLLDNL